MTKCSINTFQNTVEDNRILHNILPNKIQVRTLHMRRFQTVEKKRTNTWGDMEEGRKILIKSEITDNLVDRNNKKILHCYRRNFFFAFWSIYSCHRPTPMPNLSLKTQTKKHKIKNIQFFTSFKLLNFKNVLNFFSLLIFLFKVERFTLKKKT